MQKNVLVNRLFLVGMEAWEETSIHAQFGAESHFLSLTPSPEKSFDRMILTQLRMLIQYAAIEEVYVSEFVCDPFHKGTKSNDLAWKKRELQRVVQELSAPMVLGSMIELGKLSVHALLFDRGSKSYKQLSFDKPSSPTFGLSKEGAFRNEKHLSLWYN